MSTKRPYEQKARAAKAAETRQRITEATLALHAEVGPARTTVAEVARRAGVQRLTVYNHFPEERDLLAACNAHFLGQHPPPDVARCLAIEDPAVRLRAVLEAFYGWYRATEGVTAKVQRDAEVLPALAELMAGPAAQMDELAGALAAGFGRSRRVRAAVALALDFWAWRRLAASGLTDAAAAEVMVGAVVATSSRR
jgi:AcrR family transcriptional regulator